MDNLDLNLIFTKEELENVTQVVLNKPSVVGARHLALLVCYGLVFLLGVPGNALVVWVTGFRMPRSVTSLWFLNLALADLLCCLTLPLLMVSLTLDQHWPFGLVACKLLKGLIYLVLYCSVLLLVLISLDRWLMVSRPVWCQNRRRPQWASWVCAGVWLLAFLGTIPQFIHLNEVRLSPTKALCVGQYTNASGWAVTTLRFVLTFLLPFLIIVSCHLVVYCRAERGANMGRGGANAARTRRMLRVIAAVVLSFFLCWLPLHLLDFLLLKTPLDSPHSANINLAHALAFCLAYSNSCLNPLLYVCLGPGFKDSLSRSLRSVLNFATEEPVGRTSISNTKSSVESTTVV